MVTAKRFEQVAPELCERVAAGASFADACHALEVKTNTARAWLRKGRTDPEGLYGRFAAGIDAAKAAQAVVSEAAGAMTLEEWEAHLAAAVRAGSVPAMKLFADTHRQEAPERADPFAEFDELAERRRGKAGA
jgi:hypothetical protein